MLVLTWGLLAICLIDAEHQIVPDVLVFPLLWLGLLLNSFSLFTTLGQAVWGAALGYACLWSVFWMFKLITGKDGMGYGDFKLLAVLGAWGGVAVLPLTILLSSLLGAAAGLGCCSCAGRGPVPRSPLHRIWQLPAGLHCSGVVK